MIQLLRVTFVCTFLNAKQIKHTCNLKTEINAETLPKQLNKQIYYVTHFKFYIPWEIFSWIIYYMCEI